MTEPSFGVRYRLGGGGCEWRQRIHRSHRLGGEVLLGPALYQPTDLLVGGGQHPAAIRIKVARADEDLIAVVECSHANGDRSEDLLFPHPRSIAGREQTPTTLTRTPLDPASGPTRVGVPLVPSRCLLVGGPGPRKPKTPPRRGLDQRSLLVGVAGFEPTASSSRTKRAAKLRHTPRYAVSNSSGHPPGRPRGFPRAGGARGTASPDQRCPLPARESVSEGSR